MTSKWFRLIVTTTLVIFLLSSTILASSEIKDFVGKGEAGFADGDLSAGKLNQPWGLVADKDGNLIIVDSANQKIRKVVGGKLTTIAGFTKSNDAYGLPKGGLVDGDALQAMFKNPRFAAVDSKGDLYISDTRNHVIRKLSNGKIFTYAGTGVAGAVDGDRAKAQFNSPSGLAIDSKNNLYIADTMNQVIRKITPDGKVSTFAGMTGKSGYVDGELAKSQFNEPCDLAIDEKGNLYLSDSGNHLIRIISGDKVSTYAGVPTDVNSETGYMQGGYQNGEKSKARFNFPKGIAYADGTLFIADSLNQRIRAIKADGTVINLAGTSVAGDVSGSVEQAQFNQPVDVVYSNGKLYVSDLWNNKIKVIDLDLKNISGVQNVEDLIASTQFHPATADLQVWFDGVEMKFKADKPYRNGSQFFLPIRSLFEQWGAKVEWLGKTKEILISKGQWNTKIAFSKFSIVVNQGRTYIEISDLSKVSLLLVEFVDEYNAIVVGAAK